jgi:lipoic acid synthetase
MNSKSISLPVIQPSEQAATPAIAPHVRQEARGDDRVSGPARPDLKFREDEAGPRPRWIRKKLEFKREFFETEQVVKDAGLHTICESGACPNRHECWSRKSLTIMILGNVCTRSCGFCDVQTGRPRSVDADEPRRVAQTLSSLGLRYCVITSVDRDDLEDGGAAIWAETIRRVKEACPDMGLEVLTGDFKGNMADLDLVLDARPDCFSHNIETVEELHRMVRPQARYDRTLAVLERAAKHGGSLVKTGMMLGLGETNEQVLRAMQDLLDAGVQVLNLGQYLRPSKRHLPVMRWVTPEEFVFFKEEGERMGFAHVESGALVRSSYMADAQAERVAASKAARAAAIIQTAP